MNKYISNRWLSYELEFGILLQKFHGTQKTIDNFREYLRKKYKKIKVTLDPSLPLGGIEISFHSTDMTDKELTEILVEIYKQKYIFNTRFSTGLHLHIDSRDLIDRDPLHFFKTVFKRIKKIQSTPKYAWLLTFSVYRRVYPEILFDLVEKAETVEEIYTYFIKSTGDTWLKTRKFLEKNNIRTYIEQTLKHKGWSHDYIVELTPAFRYYFEKKYNIRFTNKRVVGSIEIRSGMPTFRFRNVKKSITKQIIDVKAEMGTLARLGFYIIGITNTI